MHDFTLNNPSCQGSYSSLSPSFLQVVEALFDTRIHFTSQEWNDLIITGLDDGTLEGKMMACLGRLPPMLDRARSALQQLFPHHRHHSHVANLEFRALCQIYAPIISALRHRWHSVDTSVTNNISLTPKVKRILHSVYCRILAFGLAIGIIMNSALNTLEVSLDIDDPALRAETACMAQEILDLVPAVALYRPMGSLAMTLCLVMAWAGAGDSETREKIRVVTDDFMQDMYGEGVKVREEDLELSKSEIELKRRDRSHVGLRI